MKTLLAIAACCLSITCVAQTDNSIIYGDQNSSYPIVREQNYINEQFLIKQRKRVEAITRENFGQSLKLGEANLPLLQRIIDEELVEKDDTITLQALGVILGDTFTEAHKKLAWMVYEDELGKSHAVCVVDTKQCLFPVTMLSKRIEQDAKPKVRQVYEKGLDAMQPFLPKLPFSGR